MRLTKSRLALASMIGIVAMIVAACGSNSSQNFRTSLGSYKYVTPSKGGTIIYGDWQAPDGVNSADLLIGASVANTEVVSATFDGCIFQLPDLSLADNGWKPSQCTEVPTVANKGESADGTTTTIHLDPKAKWSDGSQITATDYLFNWALYEDPNVAGGSAPYSTATLTKVDNFTLKFNWGQAYAPYRYAITGPLNAASSQGAWDNTKDVNGACDSINAQNIATLPCYNSAAFTKLSQTDAFNQTPVDNGPYIVQSFKAGDSIVMVPNPNYYSNFFHAAAPDKLIFRVAGSKDALIQAYQAKEYDHAEDFTVADLSKFSSINSQEVYVQQAYSYEHLEFNERSSAPHAASNGGKSIFTDINVRKAFFEAFDRCNAIQTVLGQDCNATGIHTNEVTVPLDPAYDTNATFPAFNAADAASLMDAAGFKKDSKGVRTYPGTTKEVTLNVITRGPNAVRTSFLQLIQAGWQKNLNINVTFENDPAIFKPWDANGDLYRGTYDVALFAFSTNGDCDQLTTNFQGNQIPSATSKTTQNYMGIQDTTIDGLLAKQRGDLNTTDRIGLCKQIYDQIANQYYTEPLYIRANISLTASNLQNFDPHPTQVGNEWNIADWGTTNKSS